MRAGFVGLALLLSALSLRAQLVADSTSKTINGTSTNLAGNLVIGTNGSFTSLTIINAGSVTNNGTGTIGLNGTAKTNQVVVTGANSLWGMSGNLVLGQNGSFGTLVVSNGAKVINNFGNIGLNTGSSGNAAVVTGPNSIWTNSSSVNIGNTSPFCSLLVSNGGLVTASSMNVGNGGASNVLAIANGGTVKSGQGIISVGPFSSGNLAIVGGAGSQWLNSGEMDVGPGASFNHLLVTNAGKITSIGAYVGANGIQDGSGNSNLVVMAGAGSTWTNSGNFALGNIGSCNQLAITNGAIMRSTLLGAAVNVNVATQPGSSNNVLLVSGANSLFSTAAGFLYCGQNGSSNEININQGGQFEINSSHLGGSTTSSNNLVFVSDAGSVWSNTADFFVGDSGSGNKLVVTNNGTVSIAGNLYLGFNPVSSSNNAALLAGTVLVTNSAGSGSVNVRNGTATLFSGLLATDNLRLTNGLQSLFNFNGGTLTVRTSTVLNNLTLFVGNGSSAATLNLANGGTHWFANGLTLRNLANLTGNGTLGGGLTAQTGSTVSPGASIGQITLSNSPALQGTIIMEISKTGSALTNDQIQVLAPLTYGGTLTLNNIGAGALAAGDRFQLFNATGYAGSFSTITFPGLGSGLAWTNKLNLDGSIEVVTASQPPSRDFGVDVSHYQGEAGISQSNWNQMYNEGKRFAFIKATEGLTVVDDSMANNMTRAPAAGLLAGVYHFAHPELHPTTAAAAQEADFLLSNAGNFVGPGYLRPVLDLETGSNLATNVLTDWVIAFANEIIANRGPGAAPIIYTPQSFTTTHLDNRMSNYDLWIAIGGGDPATYNPPTGVFNNWSFWQYSVGSAGGISPIDLDVCHSEFKPLDSFLIPPLTSPVAPAIAVQPQSRTVALGNSATFAVTATVSSSTPLAYQWFFNGSKIPGATDSAYTRTNAQLADAGNYTVILTNAAGSATSAVATLTVLNPPPGIPPVALYQENFDEYSSPSTVTSPTTTNGFKIFFNATSGPYDFGAVFGFDYSTVSTPTTIPPAPFSSGGTTKGLLLTVNKDTAAAVAALNLYPLSQSFTGNFALKFDLWINYTSSASSTEEAMFGINHSGNITNRSGLATSDGLFFAVDGDGGVSAGSATLRDFAMFRGGGNGALPILLTTANTTFGPAPLLGPNFDNADPGFAALFPSKTLPSFTTAAGNPGNGWVSVEVRQTTNLLTWLLNNTVVAQYTNASIYTNGNILIGYCDPFSSIGPTNNFAIFDNLRVETVPGPFRILSVAKTNNDLRLDWTTSGGHSYVVQIATNSTGGLPTNFVDLSPVLSIGGTSEGTTNYVYPGGANILGSYYRVRLGP